jgi:PBP1b-binding outer membrane lipoprotein LpoB
MKRILLEGLAVVVVVGSLGGCVADKKEQNYSVSSQTTPLPANSEAIRATRQRLQEDMKGVQALVVTACSEKLHISSVDRPEDLAAVVKCTNDQIKIMGTEALARIDAKELTQNEAGQFMLNQAAAFLQANSEAARFRDSAELIQIAVEGGKRLLLSKP